MARLICGPINVTIKVDNSTLKGVISGAETAHVASNNSGVNP